MLTKAAYKDLTTPAQFADSKKTDRWLRYEHLRGLIPILIIYFALAFYRIDYQSLWIDEIGSLQTALGDGSFFSSSIWQKGQGPLYFALLNLWGKLSISEDALRSLSALIGAMAVYLIYQLAMDLFNRRTAQIGALLFATSPFIIWYSQEVRYITLSIAACLIATYAFRRALTANGFGWWFWYASGLILAIGAFVTNIFLPVVHGLYVLGLRSRRPITLWLGSQIVVFIMVLFWANGGQLWQLSGWCKKVYLEITVKDKSHLDRSSERLSTGGRRDFSLAALPYTFFAFSTGFSVGPSLQELHNSRSLRTLLPHAPIITGCAVLFLGLSLLGMVRLRRFPDEIMFLSLWLAVPIIGTLGISVLTEMSYNVRYVSASLPAYLLVLAVGIAGCRRKSQITLLAAVLLVNAYSLTNYYFDPRYAREDARGAAEYLESATRPGDVIVAVGAPRALSYYYKGVLPIEVVDPRGSSQLRLTDRLLSIAKGHNRLWLVKIRPWETDSKGQVKKLLESFARREQRKILPGVEIYSYHSDYPRSLVGQ